MSPFIIRKPPLDFLDGHTTALAAPTEHDKYRAEERYDEEQANRGRSEDNHAKEAVFHFRKCEIGERVHEEKPNS